MWSCWSSSLKRHSRSATAAYRRAVGPTVRPLRLPRPVRLRPRRRHLRRCERPWRTRSWPNRPSVPSKPWRPSPRRAIAANSTERLTRWTDWPPGKNTHSPSSAPCEHTKPRASPLPAADNEQNQPTTRPRTTLSSVSVNASYGTASSVFRADDTSSLLLPWIHAYVFVCLSEAFVILRPAPSQSDVCVCACVCVSASAYLRIYRRRRLYNSSPS